eukprot:766443-Hanusia_phi.AAC.5
MLVKPSWRVGWSSRYPLGVRGGMTCTICGGRGVYHGGVECCTNFGRKGVVTWNLVGGGVVACCEVLKSSGVGGVVCPYNHGVEVWTSLVALGGQGEHAWKARGEEGREVGHATRSSNLDYSENLVTGAGQGGRGGQGDDEDAKDGGDGGDGGDVEDVEDGEDGEDETK